LRTARARQARAPWLTLSCVRVRGCVACGSARYGGGCRQAGPHAPGVRARVAGVGRRGVRLRPPRAAAQRADRGAWRGCARVVWLARRACGCFALGARARVASLAPQKAPLTPTGHPQATALVPAAAAVAADDADVASSRMSYSRFLVRAPAAARAARGRLRASQPQGRTLTLHSWPTGGLYVPARAGECSLRAADARPRPPHGLAVCRSTWTWAA
jgi:hypothetical protein